MGGPRHGTDLRRGVYVVTTVSRRPSRRRAGVTSPRRPPMPTGPRPRPCHRRVRGRRRRVGSRVGREVFVAGSDSPRSLDLFPSSPDSPGLSFGPRSFYSASVPGPGPTSPSRMRKTVRGALRPTTSPSPPRALSSRRPGRRPPVHRDTPGPRHRCPTVTGPP